jgi:hypothetical protein
VLDAFRRQTKRQHHRPEADPQAGQQSGQGLMAVRQHDQRMRTLGQSGEAQQRGQPFRAAVEFGCGPAATLACVWRPDQQSVRTGSERDIKKRREADALQHVP